MNQIAFLALQDCQLLIHSPLAWLSLTMDQFDSRRELIAKSSMAKLRQDSSKHLSFWVNPTLSVKTMQINLATDIKEVKSELCEWQNYLHFGTWWVRNFAQNTAYQSNQNCLLRSDPTIVLVLCFSKSLLGFWKLMHARISAEAN